MNRDTKSPISKMPVFAGIFILSSAVALVVVRPLWFAWAAVGALLVVGFLALVASPSSSGHVPDNAVSYVITAVLLILLGIWVGQILVGEKEKPQGAEQQDSPLQSDSALPD